MLNLNPAYVWGFNPPFKMKKIISDLEKIHIQLENTLEKRESKYDDKSEKWQESEPGELFLEKSECLEEAVNEIYEALESLKEYSDE